MSDNSPLLRSLIIAGGFLAVTAGLLFLQPGSPAPTAQGRPAGSDSARAPQPQMVQVSRAETGVDLVSTLPPGDSVNPDPLGIGLAVAPSSGPSATPATPAAAGNDAMRGLTASVLTGLGAEPADPAPQASPQQALTSALGQSGKADPEMRQLTSGILASLSMAGAPVSGPRPQVLQTLVVRALSQGQSDAYLDALLTEAAGTGTVDQPRTLVTEDAQLDTATLLSTLSEGANRPRAGAAQANIAPGSQGMEVHVVQRAGKAEHYNFYIVQPGDSLGSIARKFYGDARHSITIFNANRQFLSSPDRIRTGQRLTIPALSQT